MAFDVGCVTGAVRRDDGLVSLCRAGIQGSLDQDGNYTGGIGDGMERGR
ncbi:unnamed protein product, partial [Allacma fusca]